MKRILKTLVLSTAVAATTMTAFSSAQADDRWRYRDGYRHHGRHNDAAVAGIAGLAIGAIAGATLAAPRDRIIVDDGYYEPGPRRVYAQPRYVQARPHVVYSGYAEPWSRDWYRYCANRYRSFNPSNGTFVGYDGVRRFCEAN